VRNAEHSSVSFVDMSVECTSIIITSAYIYRASIRRLYVLYRGKELEEVIWPLTDTYNVLARLYASTV
jgi:hypothetical protein